MEKSVYSLHIISVEWDGHNIAEYVQHLWEPWVWFQSPHTTQNDSRCMLWNSSTVLGSYLTCLHEYLLTTKINWSCMFYAITAFKRLISVCMSDVFMRVCKFCHPSMVSGIGLGLLVLYSKCFTHQAFLPALTTCVLSINLNSDGKHIIYLGNKFLTRLEILDVGWIKR